MSINPPDVRPPTFVADRDSCSPDLRCTRRERDATRPLEVAHWHGKSRQWVSDTCPLRDVAYNVEVLSPEASGGYEVVYQLQSVVSAVVGRVVDGDTLSTRAWVLNSSTCL